MAVRENIGAMCVVVVELERLDLAMKGSFVGTVAELVRWIAEIAIKQAGNAVIIVVEVAI